jgi:thiol-disulfide isomerase/thioredoxin
MEYNEMNYYRKTITSFIAVAAFFAALSAQRIEMYFPYFGGKTYDFILFQGDKQIVTKDTIPQSGHFILEIPKALQPYTGMCRWRLTNSKGGGGLDMLIPGHDFAVSCEDIQPNDSNIVYKGNNDQLKLNRLYSFQGQQLSCLDVLEEAIHANSQKDSSSFLRRELKQQEEGYEAFFSELDKDSSYASRFLRVKNVLREMVVSLVRGDRERGRAISRYIADKLDWNVLFTSGYWTDVIDTWINMHTQLLKSPDSFASDFATIGNRMTHPDVYANFARQSGYTLALQGRDDLIGRIARTVVNSGKISNYDGSLKVYIAGTVGLQAPDLVLLPEKDSAEVKVPAIVFKAGEFASGGYKKTMLVFYETGCPACEMLLKDLLPKYDSLKMEGVRVIAISADLDEASFKGRSKAFPWKDSYCDYAGMNGVNFRNYGVAGTPTIFWIATDGRIEKREAGIEGPGG